ncbi:MAG: hypothetical protein MJE77_13610 [Proteobacteria bacterium]|nr:hypothetical protein [Pseudomonadota bacterium]
MLQPKWLLFALGIALFAVACFTDSNSSDRSELIQSCYDTGSGIKCVDTPGGVHTNGLDVDGDGQLDQFVCGDGVSDSDEDDEGVDDDEGSQAFKTGSDEDSDSDSDSDCSDSESGEGDSDSDSESDAEGDGDADGVDDEQDCDCMPVDDLPPGDGEPPPGDGEPPPGDGPIVR